MKQAAILAAVGGIGLALVAGFLAPRHLPAQQPAQPAIPVVEESPEPNEQEWLHTLGDQVWDFRALAPTYKPLKGELDPATSQAEWTLELLRDLTPGEIAVQTTVQGSPFKPVLLDEERIVVKGGGRIKLSEISGKAGDAVRLTMLLPPAEALARVKTVRLERRTQIGF